MSMDDLVRNAEKGDVDAQYKLAEIYYNGHGVAKDIEKAIAWYEKSAEQGNSSSMYALALHYCLAEKTDEAKGWGEKAKVAGHAISSNRLKRLGVHYP